MVLEIPTELELRERLINQVVARTDLTDMNDSSAIKRILLAFAAELAEGYYSMTRLRDMFGLNAAGQDLDERLLDYPGRLQLRRGARRATGYVQFSRATATASAVSFPAGTLLASDTNLLYETLSDGAIAASATTSGSVEVRAVAAGIDYNLGSGELTAFSGSPPTGVNSVVNITAIQGGRDEESDYALVARIQNYVSSLSGSTLEAMRQAVLDVEDTETGKYVQYALAVQDPVDLGKSYIYIEDGSGSTADTESTVAYESLTGSAAGGEQYFRLANWPVYEPDGVYIEITRGAGTVLPVEGTDYRVNYATGVIYFVDPTYIVASDLVEADYTYYVGLVKECQRVITGDPDDRINYPGKQAAGSVTQVLAATVNFVSVEGTVYLTENAPDGALERAIGNVVDYINSVQGSADGSTVYVVLNEIIGAIMQEPGIQDVALTTPVANVPISTGEVARATVGTVLLTT